MISLNDFEKKQMIVYKPKDGDKMSYRNDNLIVKDANGKIKYQYSCYRIFMIIVVGDVTITTGLLRRIKKYGISICFMTLGFKVYSVIGSPAEGNTLLREKQYNNNIKTDIAQWIVYNKIINQRMTLNKIRNKSIYVKEGIKLLDKYIHTLENENFEADSLRGIEGNAAKVYFSRVFDYLQWKGRKPRIKYDYVNSLMDIGYNLLFNFIDAVLQVFGFDTYIGFLHTAFYMRKSLVCDIMEPFRVIIDWKVRTGIALGQFKKDDFKEYNGQWQLEYNKSSEYAGIFFTEILEHKEQIFLYIREFYRSFMKGNDIGKYKIYKYVSGSIEETDAMRWHNNVGN